VLKRLFTFVAGLLLALIAVLAINTWRTPSRQIAAAPVAPLKMDEAAAAERLAAAVRIATVSSATDPGANADKFEQMHRHLEQSFPRVHAQLKHERIGTGANNYALLYTWPGRDPSAKPVLLMAHMDVVAVDEASAAQWAQPGFSGAIKDGYIWGRGAWDNKSNLMSQLEAIETLLASGFQPRQTIMLFSCADEEVDGLRGSNVAAALMKQRGVRFDFVIDEGLVVTQGLMPGVAVPAALIGIAQKGYVTAELSVDLPKGGHSSMPPRESVIGTLSAGLARLQANDYEARLNGVPAEMLEHLGPEMAFPNNVVMANLWLFRPLVASKLAASDTTRAQLHTTTAITVVNGGIKDNILPSRAQALVNFRILPGETSDSVIEHVRRAVNDSRITVTKPNHSVFEPTRVASISSSGYRAIEKSIREVFPGSVVAPGLFTARADAGYFDGVADNVYLFSPVRMGVDDGARFHGVNERISVANYIEMINFYHRLLRNAAL
jgi:carboxypeptidase PM20D1